MKRFFSALLIGATLAMPINMTVCSADGKRNKVQLKNIVASIKTKSEKIAKIKKYLITAAIVGLGALCVYEIKENRKLEQSLKDLNTEKNDLEAINIEALKTKEDMLKNKEKLTSSLKQCQIKLSESNEANSKYQKELKESNEAKDQCQTELSESNEAKDQCQKELKESNEANSKYQKELKESNKANSKCQKELKESNEANSKCQKELKESNEAKDKSN